MPKSLARRPLLPGPMPGSPARNGPATRDWQGQEHDAEPKGVAKREKRTRKAKERREGAAS